MGKIEEIKKRLENYQTEYLPYFENNGDMREWNAMYEDIKLLMNHLRVAEEALVYCSNEDNAKDVILQMFSITTARKALAKIRDDEGRTAIDATEPPGPDKEV